MNNNTNNPQSLNEIDSKVENTMKNERKIERTQGKIVRWSEFHTLIEKWKKKKIEISREFDRTPISREEVHSVGRREKKVRREE